MTDYLLTLSIGPVQSLIEAGRRTRDLWCGSWLLSEVSRAVAYALHQAQTGCLIFPCPENPDTELLPQGSLNENSPSANIANVIRAEIHTADKAELTRIVQRAKEAAQNRLADIVKAARAKLKDDQTDEHIWQQQLEDMLEIFAAWVVFTQDTYPQASKRLSALLAARKNTRDFAPMQDSREGIFKSDLDGANNSVISHLHRPGNGPDNKSEAKKQLGLDTNEHLDVLGVIKRLAGPSEQFTAFSRIVADSWLQQWKDTPGDANLAALKQGYKTLVNQELATGVKGNDQTYQLFPFDGEYLFSSRLERLDATGEVKQPLKAALAAINSSPLPYGVLLKADGDRMGELLGEARDANESRMLSKALHQFACQVRRIVQQHRGHAVYAGGDDVLVFLPLAGAFKCAQKLAMAFHTHMASAATQLKQPPDSLPTLSVGLAIGHFVQPMRQLRHRAISAEQLAKGSDQQTPRNALAICLGIRSGHELRWRCNWDDQKTLDAMECFIVACQNKELPSRISQDLREMAHRLKWTYDHPKGEQALAGIRTSELARLFERANQPGGDQKLPDSLKQMLLAQANAMTLDDLANQLTMARWLAAKTANDIGEPV